MDPVEAIFAQIRNVPHDVSVDAVFGEPEAIEGTTLIPVAEIMYGVGLGTGTQDPDNEAMDHPEDDAAGSAGGGAGARARPIAVIAVGPDGTQVKPIIDEQKIAIGGILLASWAVGWLGLVLKTLFTRRT